MTVNFNTWERAVHLQVPHGGLVGDVLRERTLEITYVDRALQFDHIEWKLDNSDGLLTRPEYLASGMIVMVKLGYLDETFPWKAFIINRLSGGVGVWGREAAPVSDEETQITYHGRNRNAPGGRPARTNRKTAKAPPKKGHKIYPPTQSVLAYEMTMEKNGPRHVKGKTTSEVVEKIGERNGFHGANLVVQPTNDQIEGLTLPPGVSDGVFLKNLAKQKRKIFKIEGGIMYWHAPNWSRSDNPVVAEFVHGESMDILGISIDADFRLPLPSSVKSKGYDPKNRLVLVGNLDASQFMQTMHLSSLYKEVLNDPTKRDLLTWVEEGMAIGSKGLASDKMQARFLERHWRAFQLNVRVVGNPRVMATREVRLKGTNSPLVDGRWYVSEARHVQAETYVTDLKLKHPPKQSGKIIRDMTLTGNPKFSKATGKFTAAALYHERRQRAAPTTLQRSRK